MTQKADTPVPEFSRTIRLDQIKAGGTTRKHVANEHECAELAKRMGVSALTHFSFVADLKPWKKGGVRVTGQIDARVEQICVVSLEPFEAHFEDRFDRCFTTHSEEGTGDQLIDFEQLDDDLPDLISGDSIDLGEVASEVLALALPLHPRKPDVVFEDYLEGDEKTQKDQEKPHPFAVLKGLKSR